MAEPTLISTLTADVDLLAHIRIQREEMYPRVVCIFRPSRTLYNADGTPQRNALGLQLHAPVGDTYTFTLDSRNTTARDKIGALMNGIATRVKAGLDVDSAMAAEGYQLRADCAALNSTAAILTQYGVEITGHNPFPA